MGKHSYLTSVPVDLWKQLSKLKQLNGQSMNSLIVEACRLLVRSKVDEITKQRKTNETLANM